MSRTKQRIEYGDFQTPIELAEQICEYVAASGCRPATVIEPTCGKGAFVSAAAKTFPRSAHILGVEINPAYCSMVGVRLAQLTNAQKIEIRRSDFFDMDWAKEFKTIAQPVLVVGNPPWVTSAGVGSISGSNLPVKSNFHGLDGLDAMTGKSNFDISEWMTIRLLECAKGLDATFALLIKSSVARRVLRYAWLRSMPIARAQFLRIDSLEAFGASTDAGALIVRMGERDVRQSCQVCEWNDWTTVTAEFGMRGEVLAADLAAFDRTAHLAVAAKGESALRWRSGIKHDCASVMELAYDGETYTNGFGEPVDVEEDWVFPLFKGSDIGNDTPRPNGRKRRYVIVPQRRVGEDTRRIETAAPRLWEYLNAHAEQFQKRRSSIYKDRPPFSVFGIGPYSFAPWKVAICGLYKHFRFAIIGPQTGRPAMLDDTSYMLAFDREEDARRALALLRSQPAQDFLASRVFWDAKRPVTVQLLQQLDLLRLAEELGHGQEWNQWSQRETLFEVA